MVFSVFSFLDQFVFVQFSKLITGLTKTDALQLCRKRLILFKCFSDIVNQHLCIYHFSNWNLPLYNVELFQNNPTKYKQTKNKPQFHAMFHDFNIVNIYAFIIFPTGIFHIMLNYSETIRQNINKQKIVDNSAEDNTLSDRNYNSTEDNSLDGWNHNSAEDNTLGVWNYSCCSWNSVSEPCWAAQSNFNVMAPRSHSNVEVVESVIYAKLKKTSSFLSK